MGRGQQKVDFFFEVCLGRLRHGHHVRDYSALPGTKGRSIRFSKAFRKSNNDLNRIRWVQDFVYY